MALSKNKQYEKRLEKNIVKYAWYKIFTKRVYLPLIAIQLVAVGQVSIEQIALIAAITSVVTLLLQIPTGYLADKLGNRTSMIIGAAISAPSPLFYVFMPDFTGGLLASLLFFGGYAFQSGAVESFMHDTLKALKRDHEYAKIMGRAQSYGLIGNVILIALIPATYAINTSLPFILGFISLLAMLWLVIRFEYPIDATKVTPKNPLRAVSSIVTWQNVALFMFAGFTTGVAYRGSEYRELLMQDIGIAVALFGFFMAAASLLGALFGMYLWVLDKLKPATFYLIDLLILAGLYIVVGFGEPLIIIISGIILMAYGRVRIIIFQAKLLASLQHAYKATLISALNLFITIGEVLVVAVIAWAIGLFGYVQGHYVFGLFVLIVGFILWAILLHSLRLIAKRPAPIQTLTK